MGRYSLHHYSRRRSDDVYRRLYYFPHRYHDPHPGGRDRVLVRRAVVVPLGIRDVVDWSIWLNDVHLPPCTGFQHTKGAQRWHR